MGVEAVEAVEPSAPQSFRPLQAIIALGGIQVLTMVAGLARTKVLAVLLGPAGVGVAGVVDQAVSLVAQLGSLSIPFVALKFLARSRDGGSDELRRIFTVLMTAVAIASTVSAAAAISLASWHPGIFGDGLTPYRTAVIVALVGVPPFALAPVLRNVMAAFQRHRESALAALLGAVLTVAGAYIGVRVGGLVGLYVANAIVTILTVIAMQLYVGGALGLRFVRGIDLATATASLRSQPGLLTFAGSLYVLSLTSPFAYLLARSMVLSSRGAVEAGWVAAAYGIAASVRLVLNQANGLYLTPLVNRNTPKQERTAAVAEYLRILIVLVVLSTLAIALFPRQWLALLYSTRFLNAVPLVTLFLLAEAVLLVAGVYQALLIGFDDISGFLMSTVSGQILTIVLAWWLIPSLGGVGVAVAFLAGNAVMLIATGARLLRRHGGRDVLRPLPPLVLAFAVTGAAGWWAAGANAPTPALRLVGYVVACAVALAFLRPDERRWLLRPWKTAPARRS